MADIQTVLANTIDGKAVHRRQFTKSDGRDLFLYGYAPHNLPAQPHPGGEVAKGGELRFHPLRREWNLYAPHRQNRTFKPAASENPLAPSLPGAPPSEIPFADFELAIFENKFTSLHAQAPMAPPSDIFEAARASGRCDVVVYSPKESGNLHEIGQTRRRLLLAAWIDRYSALYGAGHKFVMPFENRGDEAGVTLHHPHGQIYAFPFIPKVQKNAADAFENGYNLAGEMKKIAPDYAVVQAGGMLAFCPPFARFPFEVWVAPQRRAAGPWEFDETQQDGFAHLLGDITRRYDVFFQRPAAVMLSLHAAPAGYEDSFHFTAQFYPLLRAPGRVKYLAAVEQATGAFTIDVMPEAAARSLRAV